MMTVTQTTRLLAWVIVGLILLGILLYLFGPAALRTDELIVIGLLIIGLIWFQVWLRRGAE
jgi:cytochrome b